MSRRINNKGKYIPKNPKKYVGNVDNIIFRSSWERTFFVFLDNNANVLEWASEEIGVPYVKPTDNRIHTYYPDIWMRYKNKKNETITEIVEIKPIEQINKPKTVGKNRRVQLYEAVQYAVNQAKFKACQEFCSKQGIKFRLVSELNIFKR